MRRVPLILLMSVVMIFLGIGTAFATVPTLTGSWTLNAGGNPGTLDITSQTGTSFSGTFSLPGLSQNDTVSGTITGSNISFVRTPGSYAISDPGYWTGTQDYTGVLSIGGGTETMTGTYTNVGIWYQGTYYNEDGGSWTASQGVSGGGGGGTESFPILSATPSYFEQFGS